MGYKVHGYGHGSWTRHSKITAKTCLYLEYRVEQSLIVSSLSRRLVRMSACVCLPFASWRLGLARRTGPNVRRRRSNAPTREGGEGQGWAAVVEVPAPGR